LSRAENKARTSKNLREAGQAALLELGVGNTSIQDIAARAGVSVGSFYLHYESKNALVDSLVADLNRGLVEVMMEELQPPLRPGRTIIAALANTVAEYWSRNIRSIPLFADHLARHANEEILRIGTNREAVEMVHKLVTVVPALKLRCTPEFLVAMLIAMWRAFGLLAGAQAPELRRQAVRDMILATESLLETMAPGLLDFDLNEVVEKLSD
jgi:AcrR family transcriptional regulator